jgi:hypothetical protein
MPAMPAANCTIIAKLPFENRSEQGQFAEPPLKTIGKVQNLGDYCATRSHDMIDKRNRTRFCQEAFTTDKSDKNEH